METTAVGASDSGKKEDVQFKPADVAASVEASTSEPKQPGKENEKPEAQEAVSERPVEQKALEEKPIKEKPAEKKPEDEKPAEEKPVEEKGIEENQFEKKQAEEKKSIEEKPIGKRPVEETAPEFKPPVQKAVQLEEEEFSDPDSDDLDDLDDMLDEFSTVRLDSKKPEQIYSGKPATQPTPAPPTAATAAASSSTAKEPSLEDDFSEEEFAKQLQAGMADLLGELEKSPDMQKQFEDVFKQISAAAAEEEGAESSTKPKSAPKPAAAAAAADAPPGDAFQDTIRRTMERMQASGEQATAAAASGGSDDFMSEMLKQMSSGDLGGDGSEEEFSKMLMSMMEQLTNKEILYEPMKELDDKFPDWLAKNREKTPKDDLKRYEEQQVFVREIVAKFEQKTYSDSNSADREFIVDRMQKMQAAGSPPPDLVGDMASAQEVFNAPDESCNPQ